MDSRAFEFFFCISNIGGLYFYLYLSLFGGLIFSVLLLTVTLGVIQRAVMSMRRLGVGSCGGGILYIATYHAAT